MIEAAAQMFARHGFKAATTREIAHLAGLNEVTIFRYFANKPDLFWAAVESRLAKVKLGRELQTNLATDREPDAVVPGLVAFLRENLAQQPELYRLLHVAIFELPGAAKVIREHLGLIFDSVNGYFQRCAQHGVIHPVPASLATLGILGTVIACSNLDPLISVDGAQLCSPEQEAAACAELWVRALMPHAGSGPAVSHSSGVEIASWLKK